MSHLCTLYYTLIYLAGFVLVGEGRDLRKNDSTIIWHVFAPLPPLLSLFGSMRFTALATVCHWLLDSGRVLCG